MTTASDRRTIETCITALVRGYVRVPSDMGLPTSCEELLHTVGDQAVSSNAGGKRLRALLALAAYDAALATRGDGAGHEPMTRERMTELACAIEIFQTSALVHDDIIDDSDLRRGKPSAHKALATICADDGVGQSLGILLGDLLATASIDAASGAVEGSRHGPQILRAFLDMQRNVDVGQVLDLSVELMPLDDPNLLERASLGVFRWKTASYTTIAPLELGFLCAGWSREQAGIHARAIGLPLGVAFQIEDDLLDAVGSSTGTGKPVGGDIREGKRTVLLADALSLSDDRDRRTLRSIFESDHRSDEDVTQVVAIFRRSGAVAQSEERIARLRRESATALDALPVGRGDRERLCDTCALFAARHSPDAD
ncbi:MAG: polyprenyl synthetase family protein [Bifidobacterium sp.]|jgi:geranylgeranyl diphosphate synthase type I